MIRNYLKIAFRSLWKSRFYTILNVLGLSIGMAAFILITLWVIDELNYNQYHSYYNRMALIRVNNTINNEVQTKVGLPGPLGEHLKTSYPNHFKEVVTSSYPARRVLKYEDHTVFRNGYFMDDGGEKVMDLTLIKGSPTFPLDASSLLISQSLSKSLFGDENPIGKIISIDNTISVEIKGIYMDLPANSTFGWTHFLGSLDLYVKFQRWARSAREDWDINFWQTFALLQPHANYEEVTTLIQDELFKITKDPSLPSLFLYPMSKWHLYPDFRDGRWIGTGMDKVWRFGAIGILILLLAVINFINLSTARAGKRAREIGIRKSIGSLKSQLTTQYLLESLLVVLGALIFCIVIVQLSLSFFNQISNKALAFNPFDLQVGLLLGLFTLFITILAGSYPAFYLAGINPTRVLKNFSFSGKGTILPRKVLVVIQFSLSVTLIIITLMIYRQIQLGKNRSLGYQENNLIHIWKRSANIMGQRQSRTVVQELMRTGLVAHVAESSGPVTEKWDSYVLDWKGKDPEFVAEFAGLDISPEFGETIQWDIINGRNFSREFSTDSSAMILNEAAVEMMGFDQPIDKVVRWRNKDFLVIGVVKNLLVDSPFERVGPMVFTSGNEYPHFISIRLNDNIDLQQAIKNIQEVFKEVNEGVPDIQFVDQEVGSKFYQEERVGKLSSAFSVLAIIISLLGIFGLASFVAEQKIKEVGIRKVLGASIFSITKHISSEFMILVGISIVFAFPAGYYLSKLWLEQYQLKASLSIGIYIIVGLLVLIVALITVTFHALRSASINPVKTLRSE